MREWGVGSQPVVVAVRVKPGASKEYAAGRYVGAYGPALVLAVRARAVDGKATEAARRALADALQVGRAQVSLKAGAMSRDKLFTIDDPPSDLDARLSRLLDRV